MNLVKFSGHNAGGIVAMWLLELGGYKGVQYDVTTGLFKLLNDFAEFSKVYFTEDTCEAEVTEKRINEIEFEFSAKIPKMRVDALNLWKGMRVPFVMLYQDCNDQFYLAGSEIDPLFSNFKQVPGSSFADFNHLLFSVKRDLILKPKLIYDPRPKPGVVVPEEPDDNSLNGYINYYVKSLSPDLPFFYIPVGSSWGTVDNWFTFETEDTAHNNPTITCYLDQVKNGVSSEFPYGYGQYFLIYDKFCEYYGGIINNVKKLCLPIIHWSYNVSGAVEQGPYLFSVNFNIELDIICPNFPSNCDGLIICIYTGIKNRYAYIARGQLLGKTEKTHLVFEIDKLPSEELYPVQRIVIGFSAGSFELPINFTEPSILELSNMKIIST